MSEPKSFHMSPEEFRRQGHAVVDWIADYHSRIESFPGPVARAAGRNSLEAATARAGAGRSLRPDSWRHRARHPSRHYALAVAQLLRLLSGECLWAGHSRRSCFPPDWACRACSGLPVRRAPNLKPTCSTGWSPCWDCPTHFFPPRAGRGRDSGHCIERHALRATGRPRTYHLVRQQSQRLRWTADRLLLHANAFLH